jgi:gluconolactonase
MMVVAPGARAERIATGFGFTEGPVWHPDGFLLFSDLTQDVRRRWSDVGGTEIVRRPNDRGNGMALERDGSLLVCEHSTSRVVRESPDGTRQTLASHVDGRELNSPNDVVVRSDGSVYFTDPTYGRMAGWGVERPCELDVRGVYRVPPGGGEPELLVADFRQPNGLCFSPDESVLYVDDTEQFHVRSFEVLGDGSLRAGRLVRDGIGDPARPDDGDPDGIKCDEHGNVWVTGPGGIWVLDPAGERLALLEVPEVAANLCFGGADGRTLFVTAATSVYRIETRVRGATVS